MVGGVADNAVVGVVVAVGGDAVVGAGTGWLGSARTCRSTSSCCSAVRSIGCFALWLVAENELGTAICTLTTYFETARFDWLAVGECFGVAGGGGECWHSVQRLPAANICAPTQLLRRRALLRLDRSSAAPVLKAACK